MKLKEMSWESGGELSHSQLRTFISLNFLHSSSALPAFLRGCRRERGALPYLQVAEGRCDNVIESGSMLRKALQIILGVDRVAVAKHGGEQPRKGAGDVAWAFLLRLRSLSCDVRAFTALVGGVLRMSALRLCIRRGTLRATRRVQVISTEPPVH
ncbi:hypothetical protein BDY19DRAFT_944968 [Irpex rosettiformis]|uniref:Uncharacterized protein n=1 Tax=Irpex rosettiformis TaxID=378272 RepID=A0ACB8U505_9APHY|nr:hypothetical protein BDY19DRAFT_944968 [Irpex rosettiformis]